MRRANVFALAPTNEQERLLLKLSLGCAKLWNEVNYRRRQAYRSYKPIEWYQKDLYQKYAPTIGSATAQQIINKNDEGWRSFLALKRLEKEGRLPDHIEKVRPPGYWKDGNGKYKLMIVLRNDCYRLKDGMMKLPKGLEVPIKGEPKWLGKQGRAEILYDDMDRRWRVFQTVELRSSIQPKGNKACYIDLGVINLATIWMEGWRQPIALSGRSILLDWWYWTRRISKHQSQLKKVNDKHTSKKLRKLYRIRRRRFRHAINAMTRSMVKDLCDLGVSKVFIGNLKHIRDNNGKNSHRTNSMIHNFWSFAYIVQRLKDVAEEYGIKVREESEYKTSTECPRCESENTIHAGRLFKCLDCGLEAHRDVVGVLNMANLHGEGTAIGVVAHPLLLRWNGMKWEPRRAVNNKPMSALEAKTESTEMTVESHTLQRWENVKKELHLIHSSALILSSKGSIGNL